MTERSEGTEELVPTSVPLTWGIGGPVIGTSILNQDGTGVAEVTDPRVLKMLDPGPLHLSIQGADANETQA